MDQSKESLERQIQVEIEKIALMEDGTEEKNRAIDGLNKLYRLRSDEIKDERDFAAEEARRKSQGLMDRARLVVEVAGIVVPVVFYGVWMNRGFKFEETGTYTSKTFMGLTKFFKPFKK